MGLACEVTMPKVLGSGALAIDGGAPAVPKAASRVAWPIVTPEDREAVLRVLESGKFTSNTMGEPEVAGLEREWAAYVGVAHCTAVANGTAAIALALGALRVLPGEEVIVPAVSFVASALAPLQQLAIPVFADIDGSTFNVDPRAVEERVTRRTRAILAVHLHGLPAEMDELHSIAHRHDLFLVEDAAQAHGAVYRGRNAGALGDVAAFSLNATKNLPTCGEGGLITTGDGALHERAMLLRQFGERIRDDERRTYTSEILGFNHKMSAIQAAFARSQLARLDGYRDARDANVRRFLAQLSELPGIHVPECPPDRTHAWHILRLRFDPTDACGDDVDPGAFREVLHRVLRAEGVPVSQYQLLPLPAQRVFQEQEGYGSGRPWTLPGARTQQYDVHEFPNALAVIEGSLTLQKRHLHPDAGPLLQWYVAAFTKVWEHIEVVAARARALRYVPGWQRAQRARRADCATEGRPASARTAAARTDHRG
ncbi:MAG: DegT/DnrJ/EryC1/StrS family aminotransferase [Actinomycetota bacterium]